MIHDLPALASLLSRNQRLLGLDVGEKTIGMAVADPGLVVASPIGTIRRTKIGPDARELAKVIRDYGSEGPRADSVRSFARNLEERADILGWEPQIAFWDERLSTAAVERFMVAEADMTRKRRGEVVDKMAAAYILQGALDALAHRRAVDGG